MKKYNEIKLHLIVGLPGSGKTTLGDALNEKICKKGRYCNLIHLDRYMGKTFKAVLDDRVSRYSSDYSDYIVEGLILTNNAIVDFLKEFKTHIENKTTQIDNINVEIHYFNEDRDACLHNDIGRREKNARATIMKAPYEVPDCELIQKETGLSCKSKKHYVVRKTNFQMFKDLNKLGNENKLTSSSWSLGGTWGSCWSDVLGSITPETPRDFEEFDRLLESICPNLTFLQYKKLERECTEIVEYHESDYYGGCEYRAHHSCDLQKLYELLTEMGYVNLEEQVEEYLKGIEEGMER